MFFVRVEIFEVVGFLVWYRIVKDVLGYWSFSIVIMLWLV